MLTKFCVIISIFTFLFSCTLKPEHNTLIHREDIELIVPQNIRLGNVIDVQSNKNGEYFILNWSDYIVDGCALGMQLSRFDNTGHFMNFIGREGDGENEIGSYKSFYLSGDSIFIADVKKGLIHILSINGDYISNFKMQSINCWKFYVSDSSNIVTYDPVVSLEGESLIQVQNHTGLLYKFGNPTIMAQRYHPMPNYGFVVDNKKYIFQVNSHEFKIRKYSFTGKLLNTLSNENTNSLCKSLPINFDVKKDDSEAYRKKLRDSFSWIHNLFLINNDILSVVYFNTENDSLVSHMDLLTTEGDFIVTNISLPYNPKGCYKNTLFLIPQRDKKDNFSYGNQILSLYDINI